ncbi:monovalent cation:H+ antiporter, CPA1 (nhx1) [Ophidiomyces ophidiicola]|nr:monovalent cation:H+ antiporter, CPA1 (nhx1) [Ophidiomyces ophidiicola]KAI1949327.1 monovalent cation:H+ antiporter, CPA1 (nhx1) [Ophidiomyces ophidiicola]KAI2035138.1 monovalent cation:H+ antiporter, CPA1 (nhx1) [Ophidiomyces ophidiicola]KAI2052429.1 monovalent cation:H+ antiporter, CPA1 (nhx1) [Ophidiomyces ophidiicola]KAI2066532.1 monovalent cation:H+ antiporter, CPA1 (nhx1) [Ophidiomyces ophidiicola]
MASIIQDVAWGSLRKRMEDETDPDESPEAGEKEFWTSWALFILILLLITALFTSYILKQKRIQAVHETVLSIFSGMVVGLIIRITPGTLIQKSVSFNYQFFFNLLLPPIILASGYELHQANFFRNIGTILTFAFAGTFISALVLGTILFLWTRIPLDGLNISFVEAISVGATLSATDPVTILAIFNVYKVEPKLYTVIFGESILNDAIAIVLFETAQRYKPGGAAGNITILSLFEAIGVFLLVFFGSLLIGVVVGVVTALGLKYTHVRREPKIESCLIVLIAYASYFFSNGVHMSGIVSLLFCGITLKHYAYYNMSRRTQLTTKFIFQILAQLSENFIFIYLGLDLFTEVNLQFKPLFIMITVVGICVSRYMSVFPLSKLINWFIRYRARRRGQDVADELPFSYQAMLYWAGLRGAVGVALAAGLEGPNAPALRATVLVVVVLTVIIFGGTTARMLEILDIRTGVMEEADSDDEFDIEMTNAGTYYKRSGTGLGHMPRRNDLTIPLDSVRRADNIEPGPLTGDSYSGGNNGRLSPRTADGARRMKKHTAYDRHGRSRDAASAQTLLGQGSESQNGSASGSSADEAAAMTSSRNRAAKTLAETDPDFEDFNLELDSISDDDHLPPAAHSRRPSRTPSRLSMHASQGSSRPPGQPSPASGGQTQNELAQPTFSGTTTTFRDLLSGAGSRDHADWFRQLDEEYIKPKLLLDQGSGRKGPGAV